MTATDFLYPFLNDDSTAGESASESANERGASIAARRSALLDDLARSAGAKWQASMTATTDAVTANAGALRAAATIVGSAGRVLAAGNGGSSCDADRFLRLLPTNSDQRTVSLTADPAVLTALANDIGVERMFARLVDVYGQPGDALVVFSTSGQSPNLLAALDVARRRGLRTIAFAGYGGGRFIENADVDVAIVVQDSSVHRIQEAQAALVDALVQAVGKVQPGRATR